MGNVTFKKVNDIRKTVTDQDKVEMAGLGAYLTSEDTHKNGPLLAAGVNPIKEINGKKFLVENIHNDASKGVNYSTWTLVDGNGKAVEPIQTTFVVQGSNALPPSNERDAVDDANLSYRQTPEQYEFTLSEFNKINAQREKVGLPRIKDVVGNSLGGGTANFIGYHTEGVEVLSLNPATVPDIPKGEHNNVVSVVTGDDILNMLQSGMAYEKGGIEYNVSGLGWGTQELDNQSLLQLINTALVYGHTGYNELRDGKGYQLDNGTLATSFLTGNLLIDKSNSSEKPVLYIDANTIRNLVYSLMTKGNEQLEIVKKGLMKVNQIAQNENNDLNNRIKEVNVVVKKVLQSITLGLVDEKSQSVKKITAISEDMGNFIRSIQIAVSPLKDVRHVCWIAGKIPVVGDLFKRTEDLIKKIEKAAGCALTLPSNIVLLSNAVMSTLETAAEEIPKLFMSTHSVNEDGIPMAVKEYSAILKDVNYPLIESQYNNYLLTAVEIADTLEAMDRDLSETLKNLNVVKVDNSGLKRKLKESLEAPEIVRARNILIEKERQLDENFDVFCITLAGRIKYLSNIAYDVIIGIRVLAELIETILKLIKHVSDLISLIYSTEKKLLDLIDAGDIIKPYKKVIDHLSAYTQSGIDTLNYWEHSDIYKIGTNIFRDLADRDNAYNLLYNIKPIVNIAIFSNDNMLSVQLAANASLSITKTLEKEFSSLMNEISEGSSVKGIKDLKQGAVDMLQNFKKFEEQLDVLAFE